jgi:hypothetical protein
MAAVWPVHCDKCVYLGTKNLTGPGGMPGVFDLYHCAKNPTCPEAVAVYGVYKNGNLIYYADNSGEPTDEPCKAALKLARKKKLRPCGVCGVCNPEFPEDAGGIC